MASEMVDQLEPWSHLHGKIVMVTGASSGLGLEICLDLAKAGCRIVAVARRIDRLNSLCNQINKMKVRIGGIDEGSNRAIAVHLDITANGPTIEASIEKAWNAFGHIDVLINNAGVRGKVKSAAELSKEEWNHEVKTNLTGTWSVSKYMSVRMRDAGCGGSIINISAVGGLNRALTPRGVAYGSSKAGIDQMTKIMALELGDYNIKVNSIAPGLLRSEITENLYQYAAGLKNVLKRTFPLAVESVHPTVTSLIRYLIQDSSTYITGNVFIVDAGYTLPAFPIFSSL
ncbi:hypothetical protein ACS0TY_026912 [Phlomoides rotata]